MGVQRDTVPHFKGLIEPEWNQIRPRAWQHFYSLPRPFENGYFTSKTAKCPGIKVLNCIFPLPRKVCPREGTEMKADFFFREKVSLSEIVGKKYAV